MDYQQAIEYIMSRRKFQKSSGHERMEALLSLLGDPHKALKFIHVAGTNGKGSVSTALSYILRKAGYKTGLFTSPYIVTFGERIQINNTYMSENEIAAITAEIKACTDILQKQDIYPTVFEVTTALAMVYFFRKKCQVVVLEAGIGGEHDSTNVIDSSVLSVFTAISLDHTQMLGDTVEAIALEKSGIIKKGSVAVSYPAEGESFGFSLQQASVTEILRKKAEGLGCEFLMPCEKKLTIIKSDLSGSEFIYDDIRVRTSLCGKHQIANMITVMVCAQALRKKGFDITDSDIVSGIAEFTIPGRMELVSADPEVILDGGHNEGCMRALKKMTEDYLQKREITLLMAFMKDKDYKKALGIIAPCCSSIVFTCTDSLRGEKPEALSDTVKGLCSQVYCCSDPMKAYEKALSLTKKKGVLIVAGSFYLVSEIREKFF